MTNKACFAPVHKWRLLPDFLVNNVLYPQDASVATSCQILSYQRLDLFTVVTSLRKFAKCLCCDVTPPPILHVLFCCIEFTCHIQFIQSYNLYIHSYIHSYVHSYIRTFIHVFKHSCIHMICTISFMHNYISQCQIRSLNPCFHQKCHPQCVWFRGVIKRQFPFLTFYLD